MKKLGLFIRGVCVGLALCGLLIIHGFSSPAFGKASYQFDRMWPALQQPWYFSTPLDIAFEPDGNVYVLDSYNNRVLKFTEDGRLITAWGRFGNNEGEFYWPEGIAVDSKGFVYVADTFNHRIQKFTADGEFRSAWGRAGAGSGQFDGPTGIALNSKDQLYVVDTFNNRVQKFNTNGEFLDEWGSKGNDNGQFHNPTELDIDAKDHVYVTDGSNHRVQKFTADGRYLDQWGSSGFGEGKFILPTGIAVDKEEGYVYVVDAYSDCVQKFDVDGHFLKKWGDIGGETGNFRMPGGISVDPAGNVHVADSYNNRIQKFDRNGNFQSVWGSEGAEHGKFRLPWGVALDSRGHVYVVDTANHRIQKFAADGRFIGSWGGKGTGEGKFQLPLGITVDEQDHLYVADSFNHRIQKFSTDGKFLTQWGSPGEAKGHFNAPSEITVDSDGLIHVSDTQGIQKFKPNGELISRWLTFKAKPALVPSLAADKEGHIYVVFPKKNVVHQYNRSGKLIRQWGKAGIGDGEFNIPCAITVDSRNQVYVMDSGNHRIQKFSSQGRFLDQWGEFGTELGQLGMPFGIAVSPEGRIYVSDSVSNRVQAFRKVVQLSRSKAIIVAGKRGNQDALWPGTAACTNFAYRTLTYRGFPKEHIRYLTADKDLDLDRNGVPDENLGRATLNNLERAITEWASDAEDVVLYLSDHGGTDAFRLNERETLSAKVLATWLDALQDSISGRVIVVLEACYSGSFLTELSSGKRRIVITSTRPREEARSYNNGSISFSNYFWTGIWNNYDLGTAFKLARTAMLLSTSGKERQHALLDADGDDTSNEEEDFAACQNLHLGFDTSPSGRAPTIRHVSPAQTIQGTTKALLRAEGVRDDERIARVWAEIQPPNFYTTGGRTIQELPSVELAPAGAYDYEGVYKGFDQSGTYQVRLYAQDRAGNISIPKLTTVSVEHPMSRKVVIVAGGAPSDSKLQAALQKMAASAYEALRAQGYSDQAITFLAPGPVSWPGQDGLATREALKDALEAIWTQEDTQDLVLYLLGEGGNETFAIAAQETLRASDLNEWLDKVQQRIPGPVTVLYDAPRSGSFLARLTPPKEKRRIVITSTPADESACFLAKGDLSFSNFFWKRIADGASVYHAFVSAGTSVRYLHEAQVPSLDANGNGVGGEHEDKNLTETFTLGSGCVRAADPPIIGAVGPEKTLKQGKSARLWADAVTATSGIKGVWAVITPPGAQPSLAATPILDLPRIELHKTGQGRYEAAYKDFTRPGLYTVTIYAQDENGDLSQPRKTQIRQTQDYRTEGEP